MLGILSSAALYGIEALPVQVEVNVGETGETRIVVVGLPDTAVKESTDRVFSALNNSGFGAPLHRTTINLAPGDLRKEGPNFDLPIALAVLAGMGILKNPKAKNFLIAGELSLSGATRAIKGGIAMAQLAKEKGMDGVILPSKTAEEAALVEGIPVFKVSSLSQALGILEGNSKPVRVQPPNQQQTSTYGTKYDHDFSEVKGQHNLRRAIEVAVAGGHNIIIIGPPGSGKSMIAKRIPTIMPDPTHQEYIEILSIHSATGNTLNYDIDDRRRPFRSPHHTISDVGLLGGGTIPGPGEISLAHNGVLFLDELPEFKRSALEVMRQPLEDRQVSISRSAGKITLPCSFMLVAAMNPCPCGYLGEQKNDCQCTQSQIQKYRSRISGPLLDRIDIHVDAPALTIGELRSAKPGEDSLTVRSRIQKAREKQASRLKQEYATATSQMHNSTNLCNATMNHRMIQTHCAIDKKLGDLLQTAMEELNLSARAYDRILKVSRTIADLEDSNSIQEHHLLEAIQYRNLDRVVNY